MRARVARAVSVRAPASSLLQVPPSCVFSPGCSLSVSGWGRDGGSADLWELGARWCRAEHVEGDIWQLLSGKPAMSGACMVRGIVDGSRVHTQGCNAPSAQWWWDLAVHTRYQDYTWLLYGICAWYVSWITYPCACRAPLQMTGPTCACVGRCDWEGCRGLEYCILLCGHVPGPWDVLHIIAGLLTHRGIQHQSRCLYPMCPIMLSSLQRSLLAPSGSELSMFTACLHLVTFYILPMQLTPWQCYMLCYYILPNYYYLLTYYFHNMHLSRQDTDG